MSVTWILNAMTFALFVGLAALAAERIARAGGRAGRWPWAVALGAATCWPLIILSGLALPSARSIPRLPGLVVVPETGRALFDAHSRIGTITARLLLAAWACASLVLLVRLLRGAIALRRLRASADACNVDGVAVLVSETIGPAAIGVLHPEVIIPRSALELEPPLRRLVLRHEREHCEARDPSLLLASATATAILPWNLPLWWIARRLHLALELDCDARVLRAESDSSRYARLLLWTAQRSYPAPLAPALASPPSHLERRIIAMRDRTNRVRPLHIAGAATIVLAAGFAACSVQVADVPPSADRATASAVRATELFFEFQVEKQVQQLPTSNSQNLRYPDSLRHANVEGEVLAQFVVGADGRVEPSTFKVLKTSHPLFTRAVTTALPGMRFRPAEVGGHAVRQLVQEPFTFSLQRN